MAEAFLADCKAVDVLYLNNTSLMITASVEQIVSVHQNVPFLCQEKTCLKLSRRIAERTTVKTMGHLKRRDYIPSSQRENSFEYILKSRRRYFEKFEGVDVFS